MKWLLRLVLALVLTLPVFLGITLIEPLLRWLYSEDGYRVLAPLFNLFGAVGVEGHEGVIAGVLLVVSFFVALCIAWIAAALLTRWKSQRLRLRQ